MNETEYLGGWKTTKMGKRNECKSDDFFKGVRVFEGEETDSK